MAINNYLFFRRSISKLEERADARQQPLFLFYQYSVIMPTLFSPGFSGLSQSNISLSFWKLYAFIFMWKFRGKSFEVHQLYDQARLIHFTVVLPKYFRFPFMNKDDIECGPSWTDPDYRGKGIFPQMLEAVCQRFSGSGKNCWVLCENSNNSSQKAILKAGFTLFAEGVRTSPIGLTIFGKFVIDNATKRIR